MNKILTLILFFSISLFSFAQEGQSGAKRPSFMVIPADAWMNEHGFGQMCDVNGMQKFVPDYSKAFVNCNELRDAISVINDMMQEAGFPVKMLEQELKNLQQRRARQMATTSKAGSEIQKSDLDLIKEQAKADIIIDLSWHFTPLAGRKAINFNMNAIDAYTSQQIGNTNGQGSPAMVVNTPVMLKAAVLGGINEFQDGLMTYFEDMAKNGRLINLFVTVFDGGEYDLDTEVDDMILSEYIEEWVRDNAVGGNYGSPDGTSNTLEIREIRIPLFDETGRAIDAQRFFRPLRNAIKDKNIPCRIQQVGLGEVELQIGE